MPQLDGGETPVARNFSCASTVADAEPERSSRYGRPFQRQKKNLITSSTVRAVLTVLVIWPNVFGALMSRAGRAEARRVREVERFGAELEGARAAGAEALGQNQVDVLVARRPRDADAAVAPRAAGHALERVDVQPVGDVLVVRHRVTDAVRTLVAALSLQRAGRCRR